MTEDKTTSTTRETSVGGLTGILESAFVGTQTIYETTIRDSDGGTYTAVGSTPEEAERLASDKYQRDNR